MSDMLVEKIIGHVFVVQDGDKFFAVDLYEGGYYKVFKKNMVNTISVPPQQYEQAKREYDLCVQEDRPISTAYAANLKAQITGVPVETADPEAAEKEWYLRKNPSRVPIVEPQKKKKGFFSRKPKPVTYEGIICPKCGAVNKEEQKFCGSCGYQLPTKEEADKAARLLEEQKARIALEEAAEQAKKSKKENSVEKESAKPDANHNHYETAVPAIEEPEEIDFTVDLDEDPEKPLVSERTSKVPTEVVKVQEKTSETVVRESPFKGAQVVPDGQKRGKNQASGNFQGHSEKMPDRANNGPNTAEQEREHEKPKRVKSEHSAQERKKQAYNDKDASYGGSDGQEDDGITRTAGKETGKSVKEKAGKKRKKKGGARKAILITLVVMLLLGGAGTGVYFSFFANGNGSIYNSGDQGTQSAPSTEGHVVVKLVRDVKANSEIKAEDLEGIILNDDQFNKYNAVSTYIASDGQTKVETLLLWANKDSIIGQYTTRDMEAGTLLYDTSITKQHVVADKTYVDVEVDGEGKTYTANKDMLPGSTKIQIVAVIKTEGAEPQQILLSEMMLQDRSLQSIFDSAGQDILELLSKKDGTEVESGEETPQETDETEAPGGDENGGEDEPAGTEE